jgi:hypothetical protein
MTFRLGFTRAHPGVLDKSCLNAEDKTLPIAEKARVPMVPMVVVVVLLPAGL